MSNTNKVTTIATEIASSTSHAIVTGDDNSGKTTLALELAKQLTQSTNSGIKITVICASKTLVTEARSRFIRDFSTLTSEHGRINNTNFSSFTSFAYAIVGGATDGECEPVRLLTASEQYILLGEAINEYLEESAGQLDGLMRKIINTEQFRIELHTLIDLLGRVETYAQYITKYSEKYPFWEISAKIYEKYLQKLEISGKFDYNSIFLTAINAIRDSKDDSIADVIIVDDAQELNPLQLRLLNEIGGNAKKTKIILIGNPEQSMQVYRGAVGDFEQHFNPTNCEKFMLDNDVASPNPQYHQMGDFTSQINYIISDIRQKYLKHDYKYADFAILARNSSILQGASPIMNKHNVPMNYSSAHTPLSSEKIWQDICSYILNDDNLASSSPTHAVWQAWENVKPDDNSIDAAIVAGSSYINRLLDTVIFILEHAKLFEKHALNEPKVPTARDFISDIESQELYATISTPKTVTDSVSLLTPLSATGLHFKTVYIIEMQEGVWPELKVRTPLTKAHILQDLLTGKNEDLSNFSQAKYLEELRNSEKCLLENAIALATDEVHIFAQLNEQTFPSEFFESEDDEIEIAPAILTLDELIIQRRSQLIELELAHNPKIELSGEIGIKAGAGDVNICGELNYLQKAKLSRLNTASWYYNNHPQSGEDADSSVKKSESLLGVHISPSSVETLYNCPLKWFYESNGATTPSGIAALLGTVIHRVVELVPELVDENAQKFYKAVQSGDEDEVKEWLSEHAKLTPDDIKAVNTNINSLDCDPTFKELYKQYNILIGKNADLDENGNLDCEMDEFATELSKMSAFERQRTDSKINRLLTNVLLYYRSVTYGAEGLIRVVARDSDGSVLNEQSYTVDISKNPDFQKITLGGRIDRLENTVAEYDGKNWVVDQEFLATKRSHDANAAKKYFIVDWKTGAPPSVPKDSSDDPLDNTNLQLLSYQIILDKCNEHIKPDGGCLVYLNKTLGPKTFVNSYIRHQDRLSRLNSVDNELIDIIQQTVSGDEYKASTKKNMCNYCALKSSCPIRDEGVRVGEDG